MVSIKFGAFALPGDMERDLFKMELMRINKCVLNKINGLEMTGMYADKQVEEVGNAIDFEFDVNIIRKDIRTRSLLLTIRIRVMDGRKSCTLFRIIQTLKGEILSGVSL